MGKDRVMTWIVWKILEKFGKSKHLDVSACIIDDSALVELKGRSSLFRIEEDKVLAVNDR